MNSGDAWQCNGHPRVPFMRHLALWSFCAEHSANCYDVAVNAHLCKHYMQPKAAGTDYAEVEISSGFTIHGSQVMQL